MAPLKASSRRRKRTCVDTTLPRLVCQKTSPGGAYVFVPPDYDMIQYKPNRMFALGMYWEALMSILQFMPNELLLLINSHLCIKCDGSPGCCEPVTIDCPVTGKHLCDWHGRLYEALVYPLTDTDYKVYETHDPCSACWFTCEKCHRVCQNVAFSRIGSIIKYDSFTRFYPDAEDSVFWTIKCNRCWKRACNKCAHPCANCPFDRHGNIVKEQDNIWYCSGCISRVNKCCVNCLAKKITVVKTEPIDAVTLFPHLY